MQCIILPVVRLSIYSLRYNNDCNDSILYIDVAQQQQ